MPLERNTVCDEHTPLRLIAMLRVLPRRLVRVLATAMTVVVIFAQGVVSAHACANMSPASRPASMMYLAGNAHADCAGATGESEPRGGVCHSHCQTGYQVDTTPHFPVAVPISSQTPVVVRSAAIGPSAAIPMSSHWDRAPRLLILFVRFLI